MKNKTFKIVGWIFIALMLAFVYLPIIILIIFSFAPTSKAIGNWANIAWSTDLYVELIQSEGILEAIKNTFILALTSSTRATIIGTVGASYGDTVLPTVNTTPESYELQKMFRMMFR